MPSINWPTEITAGKNKVIALGISVALVAGLIGEYYLTPNIDLNGVISATGYTYDQFRTTYGDSAGGYTLNNNVPHIAEWNANDKAIWEALFVKEINECGEITITGGTSPEQLFLKMKDVVENGC